MSKKLIDILAPDLVEQYEAFVWDRIDPNVKAMGPLGVTKWAVAKLNEEQAELAKPFTMYEYHNVDFDPQEVEYENGDCLFYVTAICKAQGITLRMLMGANMLKLQQQSRTYQAHLRRKYGARYKG